MDPSLPLRAFPLASVLWLTFLAPGAAAQEDPARALFLKNCASCHGESGDGQGTTELDRPARSFKDGGFSFGNTPEALFKTISTGIPGSPMAGFDSSLSEEERRLLAAYVVTLGPPVEEVKEEDMVLAVHERPLVVRGLLPSLGEGLPTHPRGLLIGDPSGITFEYDVADVRLLALRQGGFVKRTDWTGRGGTSLEPLGKVVQLVEGGKPGATFHVAGAPLEARLSGTRVGRHASLDYHLVAGGRELAHVEETPSVLTTPLGTGYERRFRLQALRAPLDVRAPVVPGGKLVANGTWDPHGQEKERFFVVRPPEGPHVYVAFTPRGGMERASEAPLELGGRIEPRADGGPIELLLTVLFLTEYDLDTPMQLESWREPR